MIFNDARVTTVGATAIVLFSGSMLVLAPYLQLDDEAPTAGSRPYTSSEASGRREYVSLGCVYCHSQQPRDPSQAPDGQRGWGRPSVPGDYVYDYPHLLGTMRTGPDLFNVGARLSSEDWHLLHLYQPRAVVPWSIMPAYPFLFEIKAEVGAEDRVVGVPDPWSPAGRFVVATPRALALVDYLLALDHTGPVVTAENSGPADHEEAADGHR